MPVVVASSSPPPPPPPAAAAAALRLPESDITWKAPQSAQERPLLRGLLTTHTPYYWLLLTTAVVIFSLLVAAARRRRPPLPLPPIHKIHKRRLMLLREEEKQSSGIRQETSLLKDSPWHNQQQHPSPIPPPRQEFNPPAPAQTGKKPGPAAQGQQQKQRRVYLQQHDRFPAGTRLSKMTGDETASRGISNNSPNPGRLTRMTPMADEASRSRDNTTMEDAHEDISERRHSPVLITRSTDSTEARTSRSSLSNLFAGSNSQDMDDSRNPKAGKGMPSAEAASATGFQFMHRPPPPPLTPPTLSASIFYLEERSRPGYAASIPPNMDVDPQVAFMHQPNPDYTTDVPLSSDPLSTTTAAEASATPRSTAGSPQRRSYAKMIPIVRGPASPQATASDGGFLATSYPPASPHLPPPPPLTSWPTSSEEDDEAGKMLATGGADDDAAREIGVRGEIISVLDDAGAGWKRHTRVYGGGVCLACLAAESGAAGGGDGGYGENVPMEDRRY